MLLLFFYFLPSSTKRKKIFSRCIFAICYLLHYPKSSWIIVCAFDREKNNKHTLKTTLTTTTSPNYFRYIQSQTATKMWLRYYLEQLFGVRWRKYGQRYTSRRKKYPCTEYNEPNVRFYKATATTDYSDCDCIDI